jgi:hypothetical protein
MESRIEFFRGKFHVCVRRADVELEIISYNQKLVNRILHAFLYFKYPFVALKQRSR